MDWQVSQSILFAVRFSSAVVMCLVPCRPAGMPHSPEHAVLADGQRLRLQRLCALLAQPLQHCARASGASRCFECWRHILCASSFRLVTPDDRICAYCMSLAAQWTCLLAHHTTPCVPGVCAAHRWQCPPHALTRSLQHPCRLGHIRLLCPPSRAVVAVSGRGRHTVGVHVAWARPWCPVLRAE